MRRQYLQKNLTGVNLGELANGTQNLTDQPIRTAKRRVDPRTHTNQTTGDGKLQLVGLGVQTDNSAEDGFTLVPSLSILGDDTRPDLDLLTETEDTSQNGTTGNTTLELIDFGTRLVDVERTNDNKFGVGSEVTDGNGNPLYDVFVDSVNVVFQLGGDGDNR